ncbi:porin family protein [Aquimarina sp. M1]
MIKKLLFVVLFGAVTSGVTAQEEKVRFGAKAGLNVSNLTGDVEDEDSRIAFHLGAVVEIPIAEKFAFQPELLYSAQGSQSEDFGVDFKTNLSYINLPLMFKYYVASGLSIEAGPQVGFLVSAKGKAEGNGIDEEEDIDEFLNGVDLGANFGLGYQLDMGLFFQGRYNLGLSNINDEDDADDFKIKNSVLQFSVGYKF